MTPGVQTRRVFADKLCKHDEGDLGPTSQSTIQHAAGSFCPVCSTQSRTFSLSQTGQDPGG